MANGVIAALAGLGLLAGCAAPVAVAPVPQVGVAAATVPYATVPSPDRIDTPRPPR